MQQQQSVPEQCMSMGNHRHIHPDHYDANGRHMSKRERYQRAMQDRGGVMRPEPYYAPVQQQQQQQQKQQYALQKSNFQAPLQQYQQYAQQQQYSQQQQQYAQQQQYEDEQQQYVDYNYETDYVSYEEDQYQQPIQQQQFQQFQGQANTSSPSTNNTVLAKESPFLQLTDEELLLPANIRYETVTFEAGRQIAPRQLLGKDDLKLKNKGEIIFSLANGHLEVIGASCNRDIHIDDI